MKYLLGVCTILFVSACDSGGEASGKTEKGAFESYTESQQQALEKAREVEGQLQKATEDRMKEYE